MSRFFRLFKIGLRIPFRTVTRKCILGASATAAVSGIALRGGLALHRHPPSTADAPSRHPPNASLGSPKLQQQQPPAGFATAKKKRKVIQKRQKQQKEMNLQIFRAQQSVEIECIKQGVPGCTVCVIQDGSVVWSYGYGYIDVDSLIKCSPHALMHIASISKAMTAMGVAKLVDAGWLPSFDTPICDVIPINSQIGKYPTLINSGITFKQLLSHSAGLRHYANDDEYMRIIHHKTHADRLEVFGDDPLLFEPGKGYMYSSYGYILLGLLIEHITSMPYHVFMEKYVFEPIGMNQTYHEKEIDRVKPNRSVQYVRKVRDGETPSKIYKDTRQRRIRPVKYVDLSNKFSAGAMVSDAFDVALFAYECILGDFFKNESVVDEMFDYNKTLVSTGKNNKDDHYGIGWHVFVRNENSDALRAEEGSEVVEVDEVRQVVKEKGGKGEQKKRRIEESEVKEEYDEDKDEVVEEFAQKQQLYDPYLIHHSGGATGGSAYVMAVPEHDLVVSVLMNQQQSSPMSVAKKVAKCFIEYAEEHSDEEPSTISKVWTV